MLTPDQIKSKEFHTTGKSSYKAEEVDEFLKEIHASYDQMFRENANIIKKMSILANKVEEYKKDEDSLRQALLSAQKLADRIVSEAKETSEKQLSEASQQAEDMLSDASQKAKKILDKKGIKYVERTGTTIAEVQQAAQALVNDKVDAVFTPTDNTIMKSELSIYETFSAAKIPHFTGADSFALNGAFLGYGVDYIKLGVETANMIANILVDGADTATLPVTVFDNGTATINTDICKELGYDYNTLETTFKPYCTKIQSITTAESFTSAAE